ncbi:MAG: hypothetical protein U0797_15915 [Gemmataceae bacterium]
MERCRTRPACGSGRPLVVRHESFEYQVLRGDGSRFFASDDLLDKALPPPSSAGAGVPRTVEEMGGALAGRVDDAQA